MFMTARRLRSMGWIATLVVCAALVMVLAFRVNALRSQVHQSQARIIALRQETMYLETEFETRANQQQLKAWNDVEFGYVAPTSAQYLDNERQLAAYAKPIEPDAPAPIRVASADDSVAAAAVFPAMVSPMTGKPTGAADDSAPAARPTHEAADAPAARSAGLATLSDRLGTVPHAATGTHKAGKDAKSKLAKAKQVKDKASKDKLAKGGKASGDQASGGKASGDKARHAVATRTAPSHDRSASGARLAGADTHRRAGVGHASGSPLIKLALKDAKTVK